MKRIVIKIGTQVLMDDNSEIKAQTFHLVCQYIAFLKSQKNQIVLVSSGAVGFGRKILNLKGNLTTAERQACAAVGQTSLIKAYEDRLKSMGVTCAQVLVTSSDLSRRESYLNLKETFETLLRLDVVPIVNENDSVSVTELKVNEQSSFGDNDKLSSIVASKLEADWLIMLTGTDGVYTDNPKVNPKAERIKVLQSNKDFEGILTSGKSQLGRGGMSLKLESARFASICGVSVFITSSEKLETLQQLHNFSTEELSEHGTVVLANEKLRGKKKWIGTSSGYKAIVTINEGAYKALTERHASLLTVGVVSVKGDFGVGDVLSVRRENGSEIGRGVSKIKSQEVASHLSQGASALAVSGARSSILIHCDDLALFVQEEVL